MLEQESEKQEKPDWVVIWPIWVTLVLGVGLVIANWLVFDPANTSLLTDENKDIAGAANGVMMFLVWLSFMGVAVTTSRLALMEKRKVTPTWFDKKSTTIALLVPMFAGFVPVFLSSTIDGDFAAAGYFRELFGLTWRMGVLAAFFYAGRWLIRRFVSRDGANLGGKAETGGDPQSFWQRHLSDGWMIYRVFLGVICVAIALAWALFAPFLSLIWNRELTLVATMLVIGVGVFFAPLISIAFVVEEVIAEWWDGHGSDSE